MNELPPGATESRAILGRGRAAVIEAFDQIEAALPFRLLGIDSDNGSEFINWHLRAWCAKRDIQFTRGRPYKKDDNAYVEQKNGTHVGKVLGWDRYDSRQAVEAINDLYQNELRLWLNLFLPSVKRVRIARIGSKVRRVYDAAQTPLQRVLACAEADPVRVASLKALTENLDPFELAKAIDRKLERIFVLANQRLSPKASKPMSPPREGTGDDERNNVNR